MDVQVKLAGESDMPAVYALRHEVFVAGQGVDPGIERDDLDAVAAHAAAYLGERLLATGRLVGDPPGPARIGRMAVDPDGRGQGVGAAVLRLLERTAIRRGNREIVLHAQAAATGFYDRAGYLADGERFTEAGIEHQVMRKPLPMLREVSDADSAALIALIGGVWAEYPGCVLDVDGEEPWLRAPASAYAAADGRMWVAESGGDVVACCGIKPAGPGAAELKSLYVCGTARRQGLGELLTEQVEDEARRRGVQRVEMWSDTRFADAHRLYERLGYQRRPQTRELHDLSHSVEYGFCKVLGEDR
jgi:predicted GNAT family N-acyltransferase